MCSIIGYYGNEKAAPVIVSGLFRMEYRGYDSVGLATLSRKKQVKGKSKRTTLQIENKIEVLKGVGKVKEVNRLLGLSKMSGNVGIGHTRWATHGKATVENAHPHLSSDNRIAIVHNGIIENYEELKRRLHFESENFNYKSNTDSEIIANLLQFHYKDSALNAMLQTVKELKGQYAFIAIFDDGTIAAARNHKPLIIGICEDSFLISSDVMGFVQQTDQAVYLDNREIILLNGELNVFNFEGEKVEYSVTEISRELADVYKGDYAHFTIKEIYEQKDTVAKAGKQSQEDIDLLAEFVKHARSLYITGSGTSHNAAMIAKHLFSKHARISSDTIMSSEAIFSPVIFDQSVLIALSQSGESADVLDTVNTAKQKGAKIISIVNTMTSSLSRLSSICVGLNCGPEIGVAATKSFTSQLAIIYQIISSLTNEKFDIEAASRGIEELLDAEDLTGNIKSIAKKMKDTNDIYVLGRGIHYPIAIEGALKLKEITYVHAEGIAGGELKHGPLALMDSSTHVIMIHPCDETYDETCNSLQQIKARGAHITGISDKNSNLYDDFIALPENVLFPIVEIVPLQLLSYFLAIEKNTDPDYPRNLAKSVTVK